MQRVMMNLGIGLGGLVGGLIATTANPTSFQVLFLGDAATFLVYSVFLLRVPAPPRTPRPEGRERGGYGEVVRTVSSWPSSPSTSSSSGPGWLSSRRCRSTPRTRPA